MTGAEVGRGGETRGILLVLGAALLWSTGGLGIKAIAEPPLKIAFYRSAIAAVGLFLFLRPRLFKWSPTFLAAIERHPLFAHALENPPALKLWAMQEAVVTTPRGLFSRR